MTKSTSWHPSSQQPHVSVTCLKENVSFASTGRNLELVVLQRTVLKAVLHGLLFLLLPSSILTQAADCVTPLYGPHMLRLLFVDVVISHVNDYLGQTIRSHHVVGTDRKLFPSLRSNSKKLFGLWVSRVGGLTSSQIASSAFTLGTAAVLPFYTLMVVAPKAELTRKSMESSIPYVVLGLIYAFLLYLSWTPDTIHMMFASQYWLPELPGIAKMFSSEMTLASAWIHLLAVDLFAARQLHPKLLISLLLSQSNELEHVLRSSTISIMKKLAWMLEIIAPPILEPFNAAFSINSAAATPNSDGFLNTEPAQRSPSG
ncbi:unnamed protein product [Dovyalis caffra]|uniref:Uncharacterized protein n=1 Tax=Dovyalis caffra TaxID=77055 RepID=A0AAV1S2G9_9ROSI|nr:unnamed protein product [Dovyalis caffra]